jgi:hypothetical protein
MNVNEQEKTNYRLNEQAAQNRLAELQATENPSDLSREIALARMVAEQAQQQGNAGLVANMLTVIGQLSKAQLQVRRMRSDLIERVVVVALCRRLGGIVAAVMAENKVPDYEEICDQIIDRMESEARRTKNPDPHGPRLEHSDNA